MPAGEPVPEPSAPAAPPPKDPDAAVELPGAATPAPLSKALPGPEGMYGPSPDSANAPAGNRASQQLAEPGRYGLPSLYVPPPGSYPALFVDWTPAPDEYGSRAAFPQEAPVPEGDGVPAPKGNEGPRQNSPTLPAPDSLPAGPGSGSSAGQSLNGPVGTAACLPGLYFYLRATAAGPIHGPLQHAYSAVSADPGSSPD